ncbi:helix-turn-helix domain-containing protein [Paenibacillus doosanensis]|uniref:ArsR/SmtB family transcription factor n=1 Tax=Paenibacillus doosanensis TaxID=1229154 RepID=UPI00218016F7|nr:helix-turn-helix domain-containing protein [Paenibacillus doosanensis]MCS7462822.1 helix-turn-helix domain-containing protein [Paenibacillus doosanensis]
MDETSTSKRVSAPLLLDTAKALSSELRLRILQALSEKPMSVSELTKVLGVAQPTISINVQMLEEVGLIETAQKLGRGKICLRTCDSLVLDLPVVPSESLKVKEVHMPVGMYTSFRVKAPCGLVNNEGVIGNVDEPTSFYMPERAEALLIWFSEAGYVEYSFPNAASNDPLIRELKVSAEVCSETYGYNEDWPSDITVSINGMELGTFTSPGDFGGTKGRLTPVWWKGGTQYGLLAEWSVNETAAYVNGVPSAPLTVNDLQLHPDRPIVVRFEVKAEARHRGGLNLFGKRFGNVPQDIKLVFSR